MDWRMVEKEVEIANVLGLHARASSKFTQTAGRFASEVWVERRGKKVNGKSITGLMMLAAPKGSAITIRCMGSDEVDALNALTELVEGLFGEDK